MTRTRTQETTEPSIVADSPASELRVAFFSDSLPERNGAGAYYHDLRAQLTPNVRALEIFQPLPRKDNAFLSLPMPGDPTQRLVPPNPVRISAGVRGLRPHIVVAITPGPFGLLGLYHARQTGAAFLTAFHTDFEQLARIYWSPVARVFANAFLRTVNRILCENSRSVLINNSKLETDVGELGARRFDVIGTPLALNFLEQPLGAPSESLRQACFVGRLAPEKNIDRILAAAARHPEIRFVIGGDGPLRESLERTARPLANVRFTGWLSREAVRRLIDESDLLLLPSKLETFGTVALEAMARGRPALVAANAGIHDWPFVREGLFVLPPGETLGETLETLRRIPDATWREKAASARHGAVEFNRTTIRHWAEVLAEHAYPLNTDRMRNEGAC